MKLKHIVKWRALRSWIISYSTKVTVRATEKHGGHGIWYHRYLTEGSGESLQRKCQLNWGLKLDRSTKPVVGKEGDKQWQERAHFLECIKSDPKSGCSMFHCGFSMDISLNFWDLKTVTGKAFEFYFINYLLYGSRKLSFLYLSVLCRT